MNRRQFIGTTLAGSTAVSIPLAARLAAPQQVGPPRKALLKAGHQGNSSDADLRFMAALGVNHICSALPSRTFDANWSVEGLTKLRARVESFGIKLDMVPLPLSSSPISRAENPNIMLGKSPERDREIDQHLPDDPQRGQGRHPRREVQPHHPRRGADRDARQAEAAPATARSSTTMPDRSHRSGRGGPVSETMWERITYFLQRGWSRWPRSARCGSAAIPTTPACPAARASAASIASWAASMASSASSRLHPALITGSNFCQGTVAEMLEKPGKEIFDVIRYFGSRGKIFNVHFRNIKGGFLNFQETFPDDGDVDMIRAMRVYKEVGYDGMIMPDHVPQIRRSTRRNTSVCLCFWLHSRARPARQQRALKVSIEGTVLLRRKPRWC